MAASFLVAREIEGKQQRIQDCTFFRLETFKALFKPLNSNPRPDAALQLSKRKRARNSQQGRSFGSSRHSNQDRSTPGGYDRESKTVRPFGRIGTRAAPKSSVTNNQGTPPETRNKPSSTVFEEHCGPENENGETSAGRGKQKRRPWTPFNHEGLADLKGLLGSLEDVGHKASDAEDELDDVDIKFPSVRRLSLPESPLMRRARMVRKHKRPPTEEETEQYKYNPWAKLLASPVRYCQATGVRLPKELMVPWSMVKNLENKETYLMPADLAADFNILKAGTADIKNRKAIGDGRKPTEEIETIQDEGPPVPPPQTRKSSHPKPTPLKINILPSKSLNIHLTSLLPQKKNSQVARLLSQRVKDHLQEVQRRTYQRRKGEGDPLDDSSVNIMALRWQPDIAERMLTIMRERVLASLEGLAVQNGSRRARRRKLLHAMPMPEGMSLVVREGGINVEESEHQEKDDNEEVAESPPDDTDSSMTFMPFAAWSTSPSKTPVASDGHFDSTWNTIHDAVIASNNNKVDPFARKLAGSIFLHITSSPSIAPALSPTTTPLIPPTITINSTISLPVFSLSKLLSSSGPPITPPTHCSTSTHHDPQKLFSRFLNLRAQYDVLGPDPARKQPNDPPRESAPKDLPAQMDYVLLVQSTAMGAGALIREVWQLWRYMGGDSIAQEGECVGIAEGQDGLRGEQEDEGN